MCMMMEWDELITSNICTFALPCMSIFVLYRHIYVYIYYSTYQNVSVIITHLLPAAAVHIAQQ
jgi:hypothetical protein